MTAPFRHNPVLLPETMQALQPSDSGRYVDATVGGGGHAEKVLELSQPSGILLALDADSFALEAARERLAPFGERVTFAQGYFDHMHDVAVEHGFTAVRGILFDLGVSSYQLDSGERGFSFARDARLDMRFGPGAGRDASELVNSMSAEELQRIFSEYGEERYAGRIAHRIVEERRASSIQTTSQLADLVVRSKPRSSREHIHPATRVFQAIRIAVNDELGRLRRALPQAVELLQAGGRLVVISFHSLEDRIVKQFMQEAERGCVCPPGLPVCVCGREPTLHRLYRRPITAGATELAENPRARSAKLRAAERLTF